MTDFITGQERGSTKLIYGFHALRSRLRNAADSIREVFIDEQRQDVRARELRAELAQLNIKITMSDGKALEKMVGTRRHQGVIARVDGVIKALALDDVLDVLTEPPLILVLDGIQDPHNLGACLRVADGAGVHAVVAPKDRAVGLNATAIKVASGAADVVPYITVTNLARSLRQMQERGIWVMGADGDAEKNIYQLDQKVPLAWVLGAEGDGLRRLTRDTCDELVRIPMLGSVESLNVSVASGVCLFEARRQRGIDTST